MQNKTKKKKLPTSPYRAVLEKTWGPTPKGLYSYNVVILKVQKRDRGTISTSSVNRYALGAVTRQEAAEARRNFLTVFLMEMQ